MAGSGSEASWGRPGVKLLQHSGLGSNTGMGFHHTNDLHQCLKLVRILFGFVDLFQNSEVCLFTDYL